MLRMMPHTPVLRPTGVAGKRGSTCGLCCRRNRQRPAPADAGADCEAVGGALPAASNWPLQLEQASQQLPGVQYGNNQHHQGVSLQATTVQNTSVDARLGGLVAEVQ